METGCAIIDLLPPKEVTAMELLRLTDPHHSLFERAFGLYEKSFPFLERRDMDAHCRMLKKADFHMDILMEKADFAGIVFYWETDSFLFLEHLATCPEKRNNGFGGAALGLLKAKEKPIILEIEPPVDELTRRRLGFYERNGLILNPYRHIQAKYHPGDEDLELKILSHPRVLTKDEYDGFYTYMIREVSLCGA